MICVDCRNEMNPQERYCSRCGRDSSTGRVHASFPHVVRDRDSHVKVLAWIYIISPLFIVLPGIVLMVVMLRMSHPAFHFEGPLLFMIALTFLSIPAGALIAGLGMLKYREWARILALVLAAIMLVVFPFGTAIGIYAFWVLLSGEGSRSYKRGLAPGENGWLEAPGAG